jgi:uncharacterized protein YtpQ (UPF0354 family)
MNSPFPIMPRLKHSTWDGKDQVVCRRLTDKVDLPDVPWVAFGFDGPEQIEFINRNQLPEAGMSEQALEQQALRNLRSHPAQWNRRLIDVGTLGKLELLGCSGDYFTSEQILNRDFMGKGHRLINSKELAVAVPYSGGLLAMNGKQSGAEHLEKLTIFMMLVSDLYNEPSSQPISPVVFRMVDGEIVGKLTVTIPKDRLS